MPSWDQHSSKEVVAKGLVKLYALSFYALHCLLIQPSNTFTMFISNLGVNHLRFVHWIMFLLTDTILYEKVVQVLTKQSLRDGIMQASPLSQTSCLEGFHSVVNHFAPKMIAYSYSGQYCRYRKNSQNSADSKHVILIILIKFLFY